MRVFAAEKNYPQPTELSLSTQIKFLMTQSKYEVSGRFSRVMWGGNSPSLRFTTSSAFQLWPLNVGSICFIKRCATPPFSIRRNKGQAHQAEKLRSGGTLALGHWQSETCHQTAKRITPEPRKKTGVHVWETADFNSSNAFRRYREYMAESSLPMSLEYRSDEPFQARFAATAIGPGLIAKIRSKSAHVRADPVAMLEPWRRWVSYCPFPVRNSRHRTCRTYGVCAPGRHHYSRWKGTV